MAGRSPSSSLMARARAYQSAASSSHPRRYATLPSSWKPAAIPGRSPSSSLMARARAYQSAASSSRPRSRATMPSRWACDEDRYRILSQSVRSGRSPVVGGRLVVRYRPSRLIVGWPSGVSRATSAGSSGYPLAVRCSRRPGSRPSATRTRRPARRASAGLDALPRLATSPPSRYAPPITDSRQHQVT